MHYTLIVTNTVQIPIIIPQKMLESILPLLTLLPRYILLKFIIKRYNYFIFKIFNPFNRCISLVP